MLLIEIILRRGRKHTKTACHVCSVKRKEEMERVTGGNKKYTESGARSVDAHMISTMWT